MKYIFIDFEMQRIDPYFRKSHPELSYHEIIEIGAVMLDDHYAEIAEFKQYVRPSFGSIRPEIEHLTGITAHDVDKAPSSEEALSSFCSWMGTGERLIYAWSTSDLDQLTKEVAGKGITCVDIAALSAVWHDFQEEYSKLLGIADRVSLSNAIGALGRCYSGRAHDALTDARNTADLFRLSRDTEKFRAAAKPVTDAMQPKEATYTMADVFGDLAALLNANSTDEQ